MILALLLVAGIVLMLLCLDALGDLMMISFACLAFLSRAFRAGLNSWMRRHAQRGDL
jgi:hypothetical protein